MSEQERWKINDRVVRKSKPAEAGTVVVQQYTSWDGSGEYVKVLWDASRSKSIIRADRVKAAPEEPKSYPDWESAQEALDRGETVRIEMPPFKIDPALVQLALDLQAKERLEEWRKSLEKGEQQG